MKPKVLIPVIILGTFFLTTYIYLVSYYFSNQTQSIQNQTKTDNIAQRSTEKVLRVIDGDTFIIEGDIKVRLIGIDTPEMKNKNKTIDCFANEAKIKLTNLIEGKEVSLEKDVSETDKYGRLLRYVYLDSQMINYQLVREGYARIATFPPDITHADLFLSGEKLARENNLGLWKSCK